MQYTSHSKTQSKLVLFIYHLLQNGVPVRRIEKAADMATIALEDRPRDVVLNNGWFAGAAQDFARKLSPGESAIIPPQFGEEGKPKKRRGRPLKALKAA